MPIQRVERVLIVGLDCAAPRFVFDRATLPLPALHGLMERGCWGPLESCHPPITVPAWSCMTTGKDAGTLGVYGFRNRRDHSYEGMAIASAADVHEKRLWDYAGDAGLDSVVLGVPQTYPPRPLRGRLVSGLLTPDTKRAYTYPEELGEEVRREVGEYLVDVADFRTEDKARLLERLHALLHNRFDIAEYLLRTKPWQLFMMVEIGLDRLHHAFWQESDPEHPLYRPESAYRDAIPEYYRALDERVGRLLAMVDDRTAVLVVSDHGARALQGGFAINQWLVDNGYLVLKERIDAPASLTMDMVDWTRTRAWGEGGYYGRIWLNVKGREPQGVVAPAEYEAVRDELIAMLEAVCGPDGAVMGNRVLKPEEIYATVNGVPPDLMAYFGGLGWRSVGRVGVGWFREANDTGPDGANHDFAGVFILDDRSGRGGLRVDDASLFHVAPTVLALLGLVAPEGMGGKSLAVSM